MRELRSGGNQKSLSVVSNFFIGGIDRSTAVQASINMEVIIVYNLKFVGPLEFMLVAPMPEQLKTPQCISMKPPESHIKSCQPKNWAKLFPYSLYRAL